MEQEVISRRLRRGLGVYLVLVAAGTVLFAGVAVRSAHPWILGEWLINYCGGFVRRGLAGTVLMGLSRGLRLPLLPLAGLVTCGLYLGWYWCVWRLSQGVRWGWAMVALLVSPATLAFPVLDPPSSVRKEVILFALTGALCLLVRAGRVRWATLLLICGAPAIVLVHEGLAVFLPYAWVPLLFVRRWRPVLAAAVLSGLALGAAMRYPGDARTAQAICGELTPSLSARAAAQAQTPGGLCGGAIAYLSWGPAEARAQTQRSVRAYGYWGLYGRGAVLALLPAAWLLGIGLRHGGETRVQARWIAGCAVLSGVWSVALFAVARDWGRWLAIHTTLLLMLLLLLEQRRGKGLVVTEDLRRGRWWQWGLLALYATCWTLPAVGIFPGRLGYVDVIRYLRGYRTGLHLENAGNHAAGRTSGDRRNRDGGSGV